MTAGYTEHAAEPWIGFTLGELAAYVAACERADLPPNTRLRARVGVTFHPVGARILELTAECEPLRPRFMRAGFGHSARRARR